MLVYSDKSTTAVHVLLSSLIVAIHGPDIVLRTLVTLASRRTEATTWYRCL